jgi:hypothetical protein
MAIPSGQSSSVPKRESVSSLSGRMERPMMRKSSELARKSRNSHVALLCKRVVADIALLLVTPRKIPAATVSSGPDAPSQSARRKPP